VLICTLPLPFIIPRTLTLSPLIPASATLTLSLGLLVIMFSMNAGAAITPPVAEADLLTNSRLFICIYLLVHDLFDDHSSLFL
jgi:hypothetical protein